MVTIPPIASFASKIEFDFLHIRLEFVKRWVKDSYITLLIDIFPHFLGFWFYVSTK